MYYEEGLAEFAVHALKTGQDRNLNGIEDFQEIHNANSTVWYTVDGMDITVSRHTTDPHLAVIRVGQVTLTVNNYPGGGESCLHNNQCTPERIAWYNDI